MKPLRVMSIICVLPLFATEPSENVCAVLQTDHSSMKIVAVRAVVRPTMHGTYLAQDGCESSLLVVLPEEIPGYNGPVRTVKDEDFKRFLDARYDHRPDAPTFEATFFGVVETASRRSGFGYYRNHRMRLVLRSVVIHEKETVVIADPPLVGKRPNVFRRVWNRLKHRP